MVEGFADFVSLQEALPLNLCRVVVAACRWESGEVELPVFVEGDVAAGKCLSGVWVVQPVGLHVQCVS